MNIIEMQLFGRFLLRNGDEILEEKDMRSRKLVRLLVYILLHKDKILSHQDLIETFGEGDTKDPEATLRNQMYRIRNMLKRLGTEIYINTLPGAYQWNPEIQLKTDFERFEELNHRKNLLVNNEEKQKELCREMISCFKGNVTAAIASELWMLPMVVRYQTMYMNTAKELCRILEKENAWIEMEEVCNRALHIDAHDEDVYCYLLKSLHGQNRNDRAIQLYNMACRHFYESMGDKKPEKLQKVFERLITDTPTRVTDILELLNDARECKQPDSAYICDYQIFRQLYRIEVRRLERLGVAEHMVLITLRNDNNAPPEKKTDQAIQEGMDILEETLSHSLRVGDVAARYSPTQFIVLLPMCSYESGLKVMERVQQRFHKNLGGRKMRITCEIAELSAGANSS